MRARLLPDLRRAAAWLLRLWPWRRAVPAPPPPLPPPLATVHTDEVPEPPAPGRLYVVGEGGHAWYAVLACPCGCGATVHLSLLDGDRPRWALTEHDDGTATLWPSVWRNRGCRSHFFVRRGRIAWCNGDAASSPSVH